MQADPVIRGAAGITALRCRPSPKHKTRRTLRFRRDFRRHLMKCTLAVLTVPAVVVATGPAHSDPDDGSSQAVDLAFLTALNQAGVTYGDAGRTITAGHTMCSLVDNGKSGSELVTRLRKHNNNLTEEHARQFMAIALQTYCPQNLQKGMSEPGPEEQRREKEEEQVGEPDSPWPGL